MRGIIPAELTLRGKKVAPLWRCIRPPRNTLLPYWTGTLRWASVNKTMTKKIPKVNMARRSSPAPSSLCNRAWPIMVGNPATIPPKMIRDIPFHSPRSVISSPSHTLYIVPATIEKITAMVVWVSPKLMLGRTPD